jgi:hypothetical protein
MEKQFPGDENGVSFTIQLEKGLCTLEAAFGNDETKELLAPYFIYVKKLEPGE